MKYFDSCQLFCLYILFEQRSMKFTEEEVEGIPYMLNFLSTTLKSQ